MEYGKIISVTGLPGLYELLSSKNDGAIVRSLDDKTTKFVSSRIHNFSHLESIEVYTVRENVNLVEIFKAMEASNEKLPDGKDAGILKKYFEKVYPDLDFERVYASDLKKMAKWLGVLQANDVEIKLSELPEEEPTAAEEPVEEKAPPKKAAKVEKVKEAAEEPEEKPAKTPAKKAAVSKDKKETKEKEEVKETKAAPKKKAATKAKKEEKTEKKEAPAKKKAAPKKKSSK